MKKDLNHLKKITDELIGKNKINKETMMKIYYRLTIFIRRNKEEEYFIEQNLSLFEHEKNLISKALNKHNGKEKMLLKI